MESARFETGLALGIVLLACACSGNGNADAPGSGGSDTTLGGAWNSAAGQPGQGGAIGNAGGKRGDGGSAGGKRGDGGSTTGLGGAATARGGGTSSAGSASHGSGGSGGQLPSASGYLHVEGNGLVDDSGRPARFTGVNWFGFETSNQSPHGLWARDYRSMLKQIKALGFNTVRLPWADAILRPDAKAASVNTYGEDPYDHTNPMNGDLEGKKPLEMLDLVVAAAGELGLKLILDNHSRDPDGYMNELVWYSASCSEEQWIADWVAIAQRYKNNPTVAAMDLDNEPHGIASWGGDAKTDWKAAAERCGNAILEVNPDVLIIVEGVEKVGSDGYWWGGNLSGVKTAPIQLSNPKKLVYSAHEYGPEVHDQPWFQSSDFPNNLAAIWGPHFDFIMQQKLGHVLIGEFGLKARDSYEGRSGKWFDTMLTRLGPTYSWTFWCWNPNSGDTEGILDYDWLTPKQWKLDALRPYMAPPIGG